MAFIFKNANKSYVNKKKNNNFFKNYDLFRKELNGQVDKSIDFPKTFYAWPDCVS